MNETNGQGPVEVDLRRVAHHLQQRVAALTAELAMKDAYIDQLHQALADSVVSENVS